MDEDEHLHIEGAALVSKWVPKGQACTSHQMI